MNTSQLSKYAPAARRAFIAAVSAQAARLGITADDTVQAEVQGDVLLVGGQAFPASFAKPRQRLIERIKASSFDQVMEAMAYTWFNRLMAIRYMELHDYLEHGYRVLSHPEDRDQPEILEHATDVELPGLDNDQLTELKLAGTKDEELYRKLLLAQCHALHQAMPFLFEKIGDETELLLPANLLHSDSLVRQLVESIDEELWQDIEIIGWLYQFYISEKKDQVIGKVVKSEDIPAATQLFTPNWIVKYMVQNSLGAQWLATYPDSPLKGQMDYYIEPAEQTDEVNAQLAAITPSQLNPEELTLMDPACGSGHILVEAYELFKAIYLERGYQQKDAPKLILEKNLFGLEICPRAAQLTGFALMMKGRADDRRLFERGLKLNVMALVNSAGFDAEQLIEKLLSSERVELVPSDDLFPDTLPQPKLSVPATSIPDAEALRGLKTLFEHATTFGSLIQVPEALAENLPALAKLSEATSQDLFVSEALKRLGPLVRQAELLAGRYDAVVMNPPYMGSSGMNGPVKKFTKDRFPDAKSDLFACFIERGCILAKDGGQNAMVTMQSWMFLASFEELRKRLLREKVIHSMAHLGARAFGSISGEVVQTTAFVLKNSVARDFKPIFFQLLKGGETEKSASLAGGDHAHSTAAQSDFAKIPGSPIAYWVSEQILSVFEANETVGEFANPNQALVTGNTEKHIRCWWEVAQGRIGFGYQSRDSAKESAAKWFPYNKGGPFRNWYGNYWFVVNWENDGHELRTTKHPTSDRIWAHNFVLDQNISEALVWAKITSGRICFRYSPSGFLFDDASGVCPSTSSEPVKRILAFLVTPVAERLARIASPTLNMQPGDLASLPYIPEVDGAERLSNTLVEKARSDWDNFDYSWDFQSLPLLTVSSDSTPTLESSYTAWTSRSRNTIAEMKRLEEENNRLFIDAYGLQDELTPEVPIEQITLTVNPAYRYGGKLTEEEQWARFRQDTMEELVSYAIGCMMGRYSLDEPGLIYAHSGNEGFDPARYPTFPADDDGIVPITDIDWFDDDAANRVIEFLSVAWDETHLEENLAFLAANLSPRRNETSRETLRRYLADKFFKSHLKTYKKRPIYWLFTSGKQKAFQCLVYLHRYNEGTLARMRSEYVIPLQGKMAARIDQLDGDIEAATSTAHRRKLEKRRDTLAKQRAELLEFDEKLRHYADQRIHLDLDDGVKVNYGKFGDLLAEVKGVHGKKPD